MSKGFLIYAHNNEEVDYGKFAICCALMIKRNLKVNNTCLITDQGTMDWLSRNQTPELIAAAFDHIKIVNYATSHGGSKQKKFLDTSHTSKMLSWHNGSRNTAYDLTPFDETIILDCDVLVQDSSFDLVWNNDEDIMINCQAVTLEHNSPRHTEVRLDIMGIPMYWATMVYFQKTQRAKMLFNLVSHVKEQYAYYQYVYEFPGKLYRNDYAFSIAIHMMNGFLENNEVKSFPCGKILSSFDTDELIAVKLNELTFLVQDSTQDWRFFVNTVKGITVHAMNKYALLRHAQTIIDLYYDQTKI
jgi:hypothetical protein